MGLDKRIRLGVNVSAGARGEHLQFIMNLLLQDNKNEDLGCSVPELVAINDSSISIKDMAASLNALPSGHQQPVFEVENENTLRFGQKSVTVLAISNPAEIPWAEMGVEYVIESTGLFTVMGKAAAHLEAGAKKVITMNVLGVNDEYKPEDDGIVHSASCIAQHLASILWVLHYRFRIRWGYMKIPESAIATQYDDGLIMTDCGDEGLLSSSTKKKKKKKKRRLAFLDRIPKVIRRAKAVGKIIRILNDRYGIFENLMPALRTTLTVIDVVEAAGELIGIDDPGTTLIKLLPTSGSSTGMIPPDVQAVEEVLAHINGGELTGTFSHGATMDGSTVELTVRLEVETTLEVIKAALKEASEGKFKVIFGYTEGDHSGDALDDRRSSIFNAMPTACSALDSNEFKFVFGRDKKWDYGCRGIDLILHMHSVQARSQTDSKRSI